jgi:hypothetical protein
MRASRDPPFCHEAIRMMDQLEMCANLENPILNQEEYP